MPEPSSCHEVLAWDPVGNPALTRRVMHDWRLLSREWVGGSSITPVAMAGWQEVWYCTRCRLVDERRPLPTESRQSAYQRLRQQLLELRSELDCRIEHGAESGGHLEYVLDSLRSVLEEDDW